VSPRATARVSVALVQNKNTYSNDMGDTESHEEDDVLLLQVLARLGPANDRVLWCILGLRNVFAGRIKTAFRIRDCKHVVFGERCTPSNVGVGLGKEDREILGHDLVADRVASSVMLALLVGNEPCSAFRATVISNGLLGGVQKRFFVVEAVAAKVLLGASRLVHRMHVRFVKSVAEAVNHGIETKGEEMLMVVGHDARCNLSAKARDVLALLHRVKVQDAGQLDLAFEGAVLLEGVLRDVLVVGDGRSELEDKLARADSMSASARSEVAVLPQDAGVLLVDADGVFDDDRLAVVARIDAIDVVNGAQAVAAELQRVGQHAHAVLSDIKGKLARMRVLGCAIWHNHFCHRHSVKDGSLDTGIVVGASVDDKALSVAKEATMSSGRRK
jgi:hypothetical protein